MASNRYDGKSRGTILLKVCLKKIIWPGTNAINLAILKMRIAVAGFGLLISLFYML